LRFWAESYAIFAFLPPNYFNFQTSTVSIFTSTLRRWYRSVPQDGNGKLRWGLYLRKVAVRLALWFFGVTIGITLLYTVLPVPITPLMVARCWQQSWDETREVRLKHDWVAFSGISPHLQLAVVCSEDQDFLEHEGFDFEAIEKAYKYNKTHKRKRGASTISQQTAKNVFLWPSRSWLRKAFEVYFTFLIETIWSKERIMTAYLNSIEFGDGIYGAEAAARQFFGKSAKELNRQEAALLASVLPNPLIYRVETPSADVRKRQQWVLGQMRMWGGKIDYDDPNTPKKTEK
jgi:monofunctional biosynthetic peptidoglycan transglycosylase